jgi:DNA-binding NarL/FixJ family response regulator
MQPPRVLVLDPDPVRGSAVSSALSDSGHDVVGCCEQPQSALDGLGREAADVVLVDAGTWPCLIGCLLDACRSARVLATSRRPTLAEILAALDAGASGYVTRSDDHAQLARHVRDAAHGLAAFSADVATLLMPLLVDRRASRSPRTALTPREHDVLDLLARGHAYVSVAEALGLGLGTVQSHVKNLYRKLEVSSKAEAVMVAVQQGLLERH